MAVLPVHQGEVGNGLFIQPSVLQGIQDVAQNVGGVDAFFRFIARMGGFSQDFRLELGQAGSPVDQPAQVPGLSIT